MKKLSFLDEVICDISKWVFAEIEAKEHPYFPYSFGMMPAVDGSPDNILREAENVGRLSLKYPNITGAFHDDMHALVKRFGCAPADYARIYKAVRGANPKLRLWSCVYSHELNPELWQDYIPFMDVVNLWVWKSEDLPRLDEYLDKCRRIFPGKPVNIGVYLRDYSIAEPVPTALLKLQMEKIEKYIRDGLVQGFSILAAVLIDGQLEQAEFIRDFIKER